MSIFSPPGRDGRPGIVRISPHERGDEARPRAELDVADREAEAARSPLERRVMAERVLGLGHADRQVPEAEILRHRQGLRRGRQLVHAARAVDPDGDRLDLLAQRQVVRVEEPEVGLPGRRRLPDGARESLGALPALREVSGDDRVAGARVDGHLADRLHLGVGVGREAVDADDRPGSRSVRTISMCAARFAAPARTASTFSVSRAGSSGFPATILPDAAVHLERADRGHDDGRVRLQARGAALDVEELLGAHVRPEARLRADDLVGGERQPVGEDRAVAVGDVRERPAVDEGGAALERLEQVRLEGVPEQDGHGAGDAQVLGGHRLPVAGHGEDGPAQARAEVGQARAPGRGSPSPRWRP